MFFEHSDMRDIYKYLTSETIFLGHAMIGDQWSQTLGQNSKSRNFADLRKFGEIRNRDSRRKSAYFHRFETIGTEIGIFRVKNSIFGEILLNFPQISTFSIKYSGATLQDFDLNSCACES